MTRAAQIEMESRNLLVFLRESMQCLLKEMGPGEVAYAQAELAAERVMHVCAEHGYVTAECAEDSEHACLVIWSPSSVEHLAALLQEYADRGRSVRLAELLAVRLQALDAALAVPSDPGPGEGHMQDRRSY